VTALARSHLRARLTTRAVHYIDSFHTVAPDPSALGFFAEPESLANARRLQISHPRALAGAWRARKPAHGAERVPAPSAVTQDFEIDGGASPRAARGSDAPECAAERVSRPIPTVPRTRTPAAPSPPPFPSPPPPWPTASPVYGDVPHASACSSGANAALSCTDPSPSSTPSGTSSECCLRSVARALSASAAAPATSSPTRSPRRF
jgi:hypothetical protein